MDAIAPAPDRQQVWDWLREVPDPEIPAISIIDLGIVRDVSLSQSDGHAVCTVVITPTYSGCPAMKVIAQQIDAVLSAHGVARTDIRTRLSPAWTTDWMSDLGKRRLQSQGIAPPAQKAIDLSGIARRRQRAAVVLCPHCGSADTACISEFGSTSCKSLYRCKDCLEPFDYFKAH
ncbi:MAG TPA: 1,2-phenylacetyl-CoA epoxidase subunit PaaD [Herbaspirillum sp.]